LAPKGIPGLMSIEIEMERQLDRGRKEPRVSLAMAVNEEMSALTGCEGSLENQDFPA